MNIDKYFKNPRIWTDEARSKLKANLQELGDISGIVHDLNSNEIPCGNFRSDTININKCEVEITKQFDKPDAQGTVALGFVIWEGHRYNYRQVEWTKEQCERACLTANALGGEWDYEALMSGDWDSDLLDLCDIEIPDSFEEIEKDNLAYTKKIETPVYTPSDIIPMLEDVYDQTKSLELSKSINECSELPNDVREFLLHAAQRHTIFNYERIADYYSHASDEIKRLMEDSALVIIDFDKAIEHGYVRLADEIKEQYIEEHGE